MKLRVKRGESRIDLICQSRIVSVVELKLHNSVSLRLNVGLTPSCLHASSGRFAKLNKVADPVCNMQHAITNHESRITNHESRMCNMVAFPCCATSHLYRLNMKILLWSEDKHPNVTVGQPARVVEGHRSPNSRLRCSTAQP